MTANKVIIFLRAALLYVYADAKYKLAFVAVMALIVLFYHIMWR